MNKKELNDSQQINDALYNLYQTVFKEKLLISEECTQSFLAYVNNRLIIESGRVISDVLKITNSLDIEGLLMTVDIEKAFDSINHSFLMCVFKKIWIWQRFLKMDTNLNKKPRIVCCQWW